MLYAGAGEFQQYPCKLVLAASGGGVATAAHLMAFPLEPRRKLLGEVAKHTRQALWFLQGATRQSALPVAQQVMFGIGMGLVPTLRSTMVNCGFRRCGARLVRGLAGGAGFCCSCSSGTSGPMPLCVAACRSGQQLQVGVMVWPQIAPGQGMLTDRHQSHLQELNQPAVAAAARPALKDHCAPA